VNCDWRLHLYGLSFVVSNPPDILWVKEAHTKSTGTSVAPNVGHEAVTSISKAAEVSYSDQAAATAGTTEQENIRSVYPVTVNTNKDEQSRTSKQSLVVTGG
jgi:hypothetical protein